MSIDRSISSRIRLGSITVEATMAVVLTAALMMAVTQTLIAVAGQRRVDEQRRIANEELANTMEQVFNRSWEELTDEQLADTTPSEQAQQRLSDAKLTITVLDNNEEQPPSKRVRVEITWRNPAGQYGAPVSLTAWRYHTEDR